MEYNIYVVREKIFLLSSWLEKRVIQKNYELLLGSYDAKKKIYG